MFSSHFNQVFNVCRIVILLKPLKYQAQKQKQKQNK